MVWALVSLDASVNWMEVTYLTVSDLELHMFRRQTVLYPGQLVWLVISTETAQASPWGV